MLEAFSFVGAILEGIVSVVEGIGMLLDAVDFCEGCCRMGRWVRDRFR